MSATSTTLIIMSHALRRQLEQRRICLTQVECEQILRYVIEDTAKIGAEVGLRTARQEPGKPL